MQLPKIGLGGETILKQMQDAKVNDVPWAAGKVFSLVFPVSDAHHELLKKAHALFFAENGLNPSAFPSLRKFENEVVSMALKLMNGPEGSCGTMTSGGTESILMAVKTYRQFARKNRPEITHPEMILPITIHPAFIKAGHYFDVKPVLIPLTGEYKADVAAMKAAITPNTIFMAGSAPAYPHGIVDPIEEMSNVAFNAKIPFHVDACVGGYILPFLKMNGDFNLKWNFELPGVTSISADIHKYGYGPKGASTVFYRNEELRQSQFFVWTEWPGGMMGSPSMPGTRPGGPIAASWASMMSLGEDGYKELAKRVFTCSRNLMKEVVAIPGLKIVGKPESTLFAFESPSLDIFAIGDQMTLRGWHMDRQQNPNSLHLTVMPIHAGKEELFGRDLRECVNYVQTHPETSQQGSAAMYGMAAQIPDRTQVEAFIFGYLGDLYK